MDLHALCLQAETKADASGNDSVIHAIRNFTCSALFRTQQGPTYRHGLTIEQVKAALTQYVVFGKISILKKVQEETVTKASPY